MKDDDNLQKQALMENSYLVDDKYTIQDLVDINRLRETLEKFSRLTGFTTGLIEYPSRKTLISVGWKDICTRFHRACAESAHRCLESDAYLLEQSAESQELLIQPCGNGLVDGAMPIVIRGKHFASLVIGQVLFEKPDIERFRQQAILYGYEPVAYLEALSQAPVVSEEQFREALSFLNEIASLIANLGLNNLENRESAYKLAQGIAERKQAEMRFQHAVEASPSGMIMINAAGQIVLTNAQAERLFGYTSQEFANLSIDQLVPENLRAMHAHHHAAYRHHPQARSMRGRELLARRKDGTEFPFEIGLNPLTIQGEEFILVSVEDVSERKRAEAEMRRRANEFAALYDTALDLSRQHQDLGALLQIIVERAAALLSAPEAWIYLYNAAQDDLELAASVGDRLKAAVHLKPGEGAGGQTVIHRQPILVDDYAVWEKRSLQFREHPIRAVVGVPVLYGGELIGVMVVNEIGASQRKFTQDDAHLLALFAGQVASAVYNARLLETALQRLVEMEAVGRVSTALRAAHTLNEMLPLLLDEMLSALGAEAGSIALYDSDRDHIRPFVGRGWLASLAQALLEPDAGIVDRVLAGGEIYRSSEFASDPRLREALRHHIPPGWGGACVLIRTAREIVGVLFTSVRLPRELTDDEVRLLTTLAEIAGNAIHRTQLHEQTQRHLQRLAALRAIDQAITTSFDLNLSISVLLDQAMLHLGADAAAVLLFTPSTQTLDYAAGRGFNTTLVTRTHLRLGEGHAGQAALERHLISIPNLISAESSFTRTALAAESFRAGYFAPLISKGQVKGVLEVFQRTPFRPDPEWLNFLEALAGQAAIAVDNAELFDGLNRSHMELSLAYDATIEGWAHALDLRAKETGDHSRRVTDLTLRLAQAAGITGEALVHIRRGALLHDIGKMAVPDSILLKPADLDEEEWVIMRQHPIYAYDLLSPIAFLHPALEIPYYHHEKWDGTGYPHGLKGKEIPLAARIFAVVDVWDALRSDRSYRSAWPVEKVRQHIRSLSNAYFDPEIVELFFTTNGWGKDKDG